MEIERVQVVVHGTRTTDRKVIQKHHVTHHDDGTVTLTKNTWWDWYHQKAAEVHPERATNFSIDDSRIREMVS